LQAQVSNPNLDDKTSEAKTPKIFLCWHHIRPATAEVERIHIRRRSSIAIKNQGTSKTQARVPDILATAGEEKSAGARRSLARARQETCIIQRGANVTPITKTLQNPTLPSPTKLNKEINR
jgi:hypothetical protein